MDKTAFHTFDTSTLVKEQQRTAAGRRFERYLESIQALKSGAAPAEARKAWEAHGARLKDLQPGDVHIDGALTQFSVMYANDDMIASRALGIVTVNNDSNIYWKYPTKNVMSFPNDLIGERGDIPSITHTYEQGNYNARDRGLSEFVSQKLIDNADSPLDPLMDANMLVMMGVDWNQEKRVATLVNTAANYDGNTTAVAANEEWNAATPGNPLPIIQEGKRSILPGMPGMTKLVAVMSLAVYDALCINPYLLGLFNTNQGGRSAGMIPPDVLARILGVDEVVIGQAWQNTANEGQTQSLSRIWSDNLALLRVARSPSPKQLCWGSIFRNGPTYTHVIRKEGIGLKGGFDVQVTRCQDEVVVAPKAGFLITGCLA